MPPAADAFVTALLNTLLSQYGALVSVLCVGVWYFAKQAADERKAHAETTEKLIAMTEKSSESNNATAQALSALRQVIERVAYDRGSRYDRS